MGCQSKVCRTGLIPTIKIANMQVLTHEEAGSTCTCVWHRSHAKMTDELICTSSYLCLAEWSAALTVWGTTQCRSGKNAALVAAASRGVAVCGPCK